jgi:transcriptional regulator with XRE-family HTH domain
MNRTPEEEEDTITQVRLRELLEKRGLTQVDLADKSGGRFVREEVSRIARGKSNVTTWRLLRGIVGARLAKCSVVEVVSDTYDPPP